MSESTYETGDLVLHMTISTVSSLFLSIVIYFFNNKRREDGSKLEKMPLVNELSSMRQKRIDF